MSKNHNTIVINGRHYDARTGKSTTDRPAPAAVPPASPGMLAASHHARLDQPARHVTAHAPKPARTLMRQAVKKPSASLKRNIKVQGHLSAREEPARRSQIISRPVITTHARQTRHHAVKGNKSQLISHFSPHLFTNVDHIAVPAAPAPARLTAAGSAPEPRRPLPLYKKPTTTAELLEYAIHRADGPQPPLPSPRHRRKLLRRRAHPAAA